MQSRTISERVAMLLPACIFLLTTLIAVSPAPFDWLPIYPHSYLLLICVFTIYAPHILPIWFVFLSGLLADIVYAQPFGAHGLCGILLQYVMLSMREQLANAPFIFIWGAASILLTIALVLLWGVSRFVTETDVPIASISWLWLSTLICYPIWHSVGLRILRLLPSR